MLKLNDVTWLYQHLPMRFTLDVARGERIAVLGPSGAGKSTLLNLIAGFLPPASGSLLINGEAHNATPPAQRPVSMLFQENNLFNHLTIRQNISLGIHPGLKLSREQQAQVTAIAGQMGIDVLLERLPGELSGGQRQRIGIARALAVNPEFIVCDEPVSALDVSIQAQVINMFDDLQDRLGLTYLFIAHDLLVVRHISDRIAVMYLGKMVELASAEEIYNHPLHPYSKSLLSAVPLPDPKAARANKRIVLSGDIPSPLNAPSGCPLRTRCPHATEACAQSMPPFNEVEKGHFVACHRVKELG